MMIGIIGPSEEEILPFIKKISNKKVDTYAMLTFHSGQYKNVDVVALYYRLPSMDEEHIFSGRQHSY